MKEDLKRFEELLKTDPEFQAKLKAASENYTGDKTLEAVFYNIVEPLAKEYGISGTYEEFEAYLKGVPAEGDAEMGAQELAQVAGGGKGGGLGAVTCLGIGIGGGAGGGSDSGGVCVGIGFGSGKTECLGTGVSDGN